MPDLYLTPLKDDKGNTTDPALDVAAYLMSSQTWNVNGHATQFELMKGIPSRKLAGNDTASFNDIAKLKKLVDTNFDVSKAGLMPLEALAFEHLTGKFTKAKAADVLFKGLDANTSVTGDETEFKALGELNRYDRLLRYVGRRSINKYGCFGCHDVPGYEDAKPIGVALADWGRKDPAKLAFENIGQYIHGHGHGYARCGRHAWHKQTRCRSTWHECSFQACNCSYHRGRPGCRSYNCSEQARRVESSR